MKNLVAMMLAFALSACGGNSDEQALDTLRSATDSPQRMRALAVPVGADAGLSAERLMDHAEQQYPDLFPTNEVTRSLNGWAYRSYPQTGVYLAVIDWRVYVVGGPIGPEVRDVGEVSDYVTIALPSNQAPEIGLTVGFEPSAQSPTLMLTATVADSDGTVAVVEYFNGTTKLGETTAEPHVLSLPTAVKGLYELSAKATDDGGLSTSTAVNVLEILGDGTPSPASIITVATLSKCANALGSSAADTYTCLVGSTPIGTQRNAGDDKSCSMTVSPTGVMTVSTDGQNYAVTVPDLKTTERNFTKTSALVSFDYGSTTSSLTAIRIKGRSEDNVLGQFFQQGGNLIIEVKRTSPAVDISCSIPLALT